MHLNRLVLWVLKITIIVRSMKIVYFGSTGSTDSDFPLLREFQKQGLDVIAYYVLADWNKNKGLIAADTILKKDCILKANEVDAFKQYDGYLNLNNIYVVNAYHHKRYQWQSWLLWIKFFFHVYKQDANIIHFVWPPSKLEKIMYLLPWKKILTLHDPLPHSSSLSKNNEKNRIKAFSKCDKIVLLNETLRKEFMCTYNIGESKLYFNKMGEFDYLSMIKGLEKESEYILFFGQILSHKGIEYLCEAMTLLHTSHPKVKLIVAGNGKYYFDKKKYEELDYFEFRNYYITVPELTGLLQNCLFAVCPYKDATQSGVVQTAFSANVPLVVTNVGALPEVVKDGEFGLVVPPCDVNALYDAMLRLIETPNLLEQYRNNINLKWRPTMSWEPIAKKYIEMYKDLISV